MAHPTVRLFVASVAVVEGFGRLVRRGADDHSRTRKGVPDAEVCEHRAPCTIQKDIARFHVLMDVTGTVQVLQAADDLLEDSENRGGGKILLTLDERTN